MKIALLGAQGTGKSSLALALSGHWQAQGLAVQRMRDYLGEWCETQQRTPRIDEQAHIAQTQIARVLAAPQDAWVIADTTALMTAVYSQQAFDDHHLDTLVLAHQALYDVTLLMGLDMALARDRLQHEDMQLRESVDQKIRRLLAQAALPYQVVYGTGAERLANALYCIARQVPQHASTRHALQASNRPTPPTRWHGACETCGDGLCEHRLFTQLQG